MAIRLMSVFWPTLYMMKRQQQHFFVILRILQEEMQVTTQTCYNDHLATKYCMNMCICNITTVTAVTCT